MKTLIMTFGLSALVAGCGQPAGPGADEVTSLQTEESFYRMIRVGVAHWDDAVSGEHYLYVEIPFTYTNRTESPVQVPCGVVAMSLERRTGRGWTHVYSQPSHATCGGALRFDQGGTYSGTHLLTAGVPRGEDLSMSGIDGTYRFRWSNLRRQDEGSTQVHTVSNEFRLEAP
jgi:hypothetical protein